MTDNYNSIAHLLESLPNVEEQVMLRHFATVNSLIIPEEALALFRLAMLLPHASRILEIGSYRGGSTVALGHAARLKQHAIYCVDRWAAYHEQSDFVNMDTSQLDDMVILREFIENTNFIKDRLCMLRGSAEDFNPILGHSLFAFVFVDGAHDYTSVVDDIIFSLKVLKPGGILCGHDYHSMGVEVKRAVHDLIMSSETLSVKGLITNTSIWYVLVDDPDYELVIAKTIREMAAKRYASAYALLTEGMRGIKHTSEIERLLQGLEAEIAMINGRTPRQEGVKRAD